MLKLKKFTKLIEVKKVNSSKIRAGNISSPLLVMNRKVGRSSQRKQKELTEQQIITPEDGHHGALPQQQQITRSFQMHMDHGTQSGYHIS